MYIENPRQKIIRRNPEKTQEEFFQALEPASFSNESRMIEKPEEMELLSEHSLETLFHWQAPEFEVYEKDRRWYLGTSAILTAIISWAIYSNSPIMAITFILIGVVGYTYLQKDPRVLDFMITYDGITAGKEIYEFENLISFWIFYEPEGEKTISLKTKSHLSPIVHIPIHNEDPVALRRILLKFIPEEKQEPGIWNIFERLLRI